MRTISCLATGSGIVVDGIAGPLGPCILERGHDAYHRDSLDQEWLPLFVTECESCGCQHDVPGGYGRCECECHHPEMGER